MLLERDRVERVDRSFRLEQPQGWDVWENIAGVGEGRVFVKLVTGEATLRHSVSALVHLGQRGA